MERRKGSMDSVGNFVFIKGDLSKNKNGDPVTSKSNAMLAVVLPDENGSYSYYLEKKQCCENGCTMHCTNKLFSIIRKNKFNLKEATKKNAKQVLLSGMVNVAILKQSNGMHLLIIIAYI